MNSCAFMNLMDFREFLSGELEKRYRRTDPQAIDNLSNSER